MLSRMSAAISVPSRQSADRKELRPVDPPIHCPAGTERSEDSTECGPIGFLLRDQSPSHIALRNKPTAQRTQPHTNDTRRRGKS